MRRIPRSRARGTALLLALVILALIATLAAGMIAQQQRAIAVEAAERARAQSAWVLLGALDWARLVLREDGRSGKVDDLGEPWAVPLAEARLSTFLAADRESPSEDEGPEAFLSGAISDLQARYNLSNLVGEDGKVADEERSRLRRLIGILGLPGGLADLIADGLAGATLDRNEDAPLLPLTLDQLVWVGVEPAQIEQLRPFAIVLPGATPVNINTAPREVLAAVIEGLDLGTAERLVQRRARSPYKTRQDIEKDLPNGVALPADAQIDTGSRFFEVVGRLRLEERVFEERSIVERRTADKGGEIVAILREKRSLGTPN
jgi:general secretion pathway protein K